MDDDLDRRIVDLLGTHGRMSYTDLGKATGLSTSAVHQRVRRLEERGTIRGYTAVVDPAALGLGLTAFVAVSPADPADVDEVPGRVAALEHVEACYAVTGDATHLLKVRVPGHAELERLLEDVRAATRATTRTTVVLSTAFEGRRPTASASDEPAGDAP